MSVFFRQYWKDEHLVWNASHYNDVKSTNFDPQRLWVPDVTLYKYVTNVLRNLIVLEVIYAFFTDWTGGLVFMGNAFYFVVESEKVKVSNDHKGSANYEMGPNLILLVITTYHFIVIVCDNDIPHSPQLRMHLLLLSVFSVTSQLVN